MDSKCVGSVGSVSRNQALSWMLGAALLLTSPTAVWAQSSAGTSSTKVGSFLDKASKYVGLTYFTFVDGPGVGEPLRFSPGSLGRPTDTGLSVWTNLSVRLKLSPRYAVDYQLRLQQIVTNNFEFRDQGGRLGISGTLLKGDDWSLTGALNSDLPGVGQIPSERTLIANPGLFANFNYRPKGSRWSLFSLVAPRIFFYRDGDAMSQQDIAQGLKPGMKPEIALQFQPSINYAFNDKHGARLGVLLDVRKQVAWDSMRRWFWPVDMGYTYQLSPRFSVYPHLRVSPPWDNALRAELSRGAPAPWTHTASVGIWLNGTIL